MADDNKDNKDKLELDPRREQERIKRLWLRLLSIMENTVSGIESGEIKLNASLLKQVNSYLENASKLFTEIQANWEPTEDSSEVELGFDPAELPFPVEGNPQADPLEVVDEGL